MSLYGRRAPGGGNLVHGTDAGRMTELRVWRHGVEMVSRINEEHAQRVQAAWWANQMEMGQCVRVLRDLNRPTRTSTREAEAQYPSPGALARLPLFTTSLSRSIP